MIYCHDTATRYIVIKILKDHSKKLIVKVDSRINLSPNIFTISAKYLRKALLNIHTIFWLCQYLKPAVTNLRSGGWASGPAHDSNSHSYKCLMVCLPEKFLLLVILTNSFFAKSLMLNQSLSLRTLFSFAFATDMSFFPETSTILRSWSSVWMTAFFSRSDYGIGVVLFPTITDHMNYENLQAQSIWWGTGPFFIQCVIDWIILLLLILID